MSPKTQENSSDSGLKKKPEDFNLIDLKDLSVESLMEIFNLAHSLAMVSSLNAIGLNQNNQESFAELRTNSGDFKKSFNAFEFSQKVTKFVQNFSFRQKPTAALVFLEASTRTRLSFESAAARLGFYPLVMDANSGSSLEKGETLEDTLYNVAALCPDFIVLRSGDNLDQKRLAEKLNVPILSGGWGQKGHPTQALLDIFTILENSSRNLSDLRLLITGDVFHSRVAMSHFELAEKLGYEIGVAAPVDFLPPEWLAKFKHLKIFDHVESGIKWANAVMALRVQLERHSKKYDLEEYIRNFTIDAHKIKTHLCEDGLLLHPGPVNWGSELNFDILKDPRQVILKQVTNGLWIRQAVILRAVGFDMNGHYKQKELSQ